jgi:cyanophycinase
MARAKKGTLIVIGGGEDKAQGNVIFEEVARLTGLGKIAMTAAASEKPRHYPKKYVRLFRSLSVKHINNLIIESHEEEQDDARLKVLNAATGIFFTGGDNLTDRRPESLSKRQAEGKAPKEEPEHESESRKPKSRGQGDESR